MCVTKALLQLKTSNSVYVINYIVNNQFYYYFKEYNYQHTGALCE